ncbi:MAG TPA: gliding-motility protein MglA, partial [Candidatus Aminicenantes bacterium]|nr:gliding-motility protein MglA [Candidatus Aminicenantes bacterium]
MAFVNYNNKEITAKIVYYGPALSGKTSCIRYIYNDNQVGNKGKLITLDTDGDRTLFFDFLPLEIGKVGNFAIKIQLYTVPGQVAYDTTRKLVLQGADGIVFVADSQVVMREQNV